MSLIVMNKIITILLTSLKIMMKIIINIILYNKSNQLLCILLHSILLNQLFLCHL